jgi:CP family cyanate transporter-like MFS transporter
MLADPTGLRGYRWLLLGAVMVCTWGITWYTYSLGVLLPYLRGSLGLSPSEEGWLGASFFLSSFLLTVPLTNWFAKMRPVRLMTVILILTTALFFVAALFANYWAQFGIRFLVAALFVASNPVRTTITHLWFRREEYATANGFANSSFGIIEPLAFAFSAPIASAFGGWEGTYVFIGGLSVLLTIAWVVLARERSTPLFPQPKPARPAEAGGSAYRVLRRREVWYAGLVATGAATTWSSFVTFWPTVAQEEFGLSESTAGFVWSFSALGILPGSLLAPYLLGRLGKRRPIIVGTAIYGLAIYLPMLLVQNIAGLTVLSLLQGLSWLFFPLLMTVPFQLRGVSPREIAVATAFIMVLNRGALALGPAVAGNLAEVVELRTTLMLLCAAPVISIVAGALLGEARGELAVPPAEASPDAQASTP